MEKIILTARTSDRFCNIRPKTSEDELKAPHMLIRASVTAGRKGVRRVRFLLNLK